MKLKVDKNFIIKIAFYVLNGLPQAIVNLDKWFDKYNLRKLILLIKKN